MKALLIAIGVFVFFVGGIVGQATFEPQVIVEHHTEIVYETIEKTLTEVIEVEKPLRHFESIGELQRFLEPISIWAGDCEDYAFQMQSLARAEGYIIDFEVIYPEEYNHLFRKTKIKPWIVHAINLAIVGEKVYYIEPQSKEVVFVINLD